MATFQKYRRNSVVVAGAQVGTAGDYGTLGSLACTDYLINLANGSLVTMDEATFELMYTATNDTEALTGTYWD